MRAATILTFGKCLYLQGRLANNCKAAFSLHVGESAGDDYSF